MELKELRAFLAVAEVRNFTRAAERLNLTQPPLTRRIAALEHKLGVSLFARTSRHVALTSAGYVLLEHVRPLLSHADEVASLVRQQVAMPTARLRIGATAAAYASPMPLLLQQFRLCHPQLQLTVVDGRGEQLLVDLSRAELDVAFLTSAAQRPGVQVLPFWRQRQRLAVASSHALAMLKQPVALADFAQDSFILHARDERTPYHDDIVQRCEQAGFRPQMLVRSCDQSCLGLVSSGLGVYFMARHECSLVRDGIRLLDLADDAPEVELAVAWRQDDGSPGLELFKTLTSSILARL